MSVEPDRFKPGARIGRYLVVQEIGRGGMGAIHLARDTVLRRMVALKVLSASGLSQRGVRERFVREAQAAAKIHHRNVVAVHDVSVGDPPFIVLEYLRGETLDALLKREAPLSFAHATELLLPVMSAVMAAHDAGVVHRDLKPANVMLVAERDGSLTPKVLDFGISKLGHVTQRFRAAAPTDLDLTAHDQFMGTPSYMPPEQHGAQHDVGPWSDVYALALMLYQAVTGTRAFVGRSAELVLAAKVRGYFKVPSSFPYGVPAALDAWMTKALAPDPTQRFATMRDAALALVPLLDAAHRARWERVFEVPDDDAPTELTHVATVTQSALVTTAGESVDVPVEVSQLEALRTDRSSLEVPAPTPVVVPRRASVVPWIVAAAVALALSFGAGALLQSRDPARPASTTVRALQVPEAPIVVAPIAVPAAPAPAVVVEADVPAVPVPAERALPPVPARPAVTPVRTRVPTRPGTLRGWDDPLPRRSSP